MSKWGFVHVLPTTQKAPLWVLMCARVFCASAKHRNNIEDRGRKEERVVVARANLRYSEVSSVSRVHHTKKHPYGCLCGGRERARTSDLYHVKVAL